MLRFVCWLMLISVIVSCNNNASEGLNKFSDPIIQKIYEHQDRRLSDSLYQFMSSEVIEYRQAAALAFASIQDSSAIENLGKWLTRESDTTVRRSLAFAIGQTKSQHSERILLGALMREKNAGTIRELLEAYGKTTTHWQLIQPAFLDDTVKAEGIAWSIYRAGLRGVTDTSAVRIATLLAESKHHERTQLGAVHFFARGAKSFDQAFGVLATLAVEEPARDIRLAATLALGKIKTNESLAVLKSILENEKDQQIRVNAVRALQNFPYSDVKATLYSILYEKDANVAIAASETIKNAAKKDDWIEVSNVAGRMQNWRVQANLYETIMSLTDNETVAAEAKTLYNQSINPYQKAALLIALKNNTASYDFIEQEFLKENPPVVKSAAAIALSDMNYLKDFNNSFKVKFASLSSKAMKQGDIAVIGTMAGVLADSSLQYRSIIEDYSFLNEARHTLSLPKDNEGLQPLENALAYFEKRKPKAVVNEFNNPIDWKAVGKIKRDQKVVVKTNRGQIKLQLFVEEAPGSVANFMKLVHQKYFDKKYFHRVVPNFVIQTGCNRGDGWGGEDYSIRSEFSHRRYTTGSVGMASAGKDTEGTQWFITHSPTPHLDGRYTIFAEVIEGMDVIELIQVGDQINSVEIVKD